jgi:DNA-binding response OmpR family regulator
MITYDDSLKKIMVVESDAGTLRLLGLELERKGFAVLKARDANAALDMLEATTPDLFILDMLMTDMTGSELCQTLRTNDQTAQTPVLILSAHRDSDGVEESLRAGADGHITKPILPHNLVTQVHTLLSPEETTWLSDNAA